MSKVIKGALLGGLILWVWSFLFWGLSGIPAKKIRGFRDPAAVEAVLRANAPEPGYYALPQAHVPADVEDQQAWIEGRMKKISEDFFASGAVRVGGLGSMGAQMGGSVLGNVLSAGIMTWVLLQLAGAAYWTRFRVVLVGAIFAWLVGVWPEVVWWGHPLEFSGMKLFDFLVGWSLAGAALAWLTGEEAL